MIATRGRRGFGVLDGEGRLAFAARVAFISAAALLVAWLVSLSHPTGTAAYLVSGSAALVLLGAYLFWPAEATLVLALTVLFYDTIALHIGHIKQVDEFSTGLFFLVAFARTGRHLRTWISIPREGALALAVLLGVISSLVAHVPITTWVPAAALLVKSIAFFYVVLWTRYRESDLRNGMLVVLLVGAVVLILGFVELLNPAAFQQALGLNPYIRSRNETAVVKSLFVHPALYGWFTAFVALFLFSRFQTSRRWGWLLLATVFSLGPFLSARRRAILAWGAGLITAFFESRRRLTDARALITAWLPSAAAATLLIVVFAPALIGLYQLTIDRYIPGATPSPGASPGIPLPDITEDDNPQARVALYKGSLQIARDYFPLGAGLGRYGSWMSRQDYSPLYVKYGLSDIRGLKESNPRSATDTFWPSLLGELGVFGAVAYAGFLAMLAWLLWQEAAHDDGPIVAVFRVGAGMVFAQAIVESMASSMFQSPPRVYLFYLAVGAVASLRRARLAGARGG